MKMANRNHGPTALILYDGVCGLCDRLVRFVLKRDPGGEFHFAALQSRVAAETLARHGIRATPLETFYVVQDLGRPTERALAKSAAALYILARLGGVWKLAGVARLLPASWRDWLYDAIARRRYRIFGRYNTCPLPDPAYRSRFME